MTTETRPHRQQPQTRDKSYRRASQGPATGGEHRTTRRRWWRWRWLRGRGSRPWCCGLPTSRGGGSWGGDVWGAICSPPQRAARAAANFASTSLLWRVIKPLGVRTPLARPRKRGGARTPIATDWPHSTSRLTAHRDVIRCMMAHLMAWCLGLHLNGSLQMST